MLFGAMVDLSGDTRPECTDGGGTWGSNPLIIMIEHRFILVLYKTSLCTVGRTFKEGRGREVNEHR